VRVDRNEPPRTFRVGRDGQIEIRHSANVELDSDEQVTFVTPSGTEFDVVRKDWGYYATPSLNGRLSEHGLRAVLVRNPDTGRLYVLLVERGHEASFQAYVDDDGLTVICWLDDDEAVERAVRRLGGS
jgi:hypothetical protein